jgi:hypothetical protein
MISCATHRIAFDRNSFLHVTFVGFSRRGQVLPKKQDRLVVAAVLLCFKEQMRLPDCVVLTSGKPHLTVVGL